MKNVVFIFLLFLIVFIQIIGGHEIFFSDLEIEVEQGQSFQIEILSDSLIHESNVYAIQYDVDYDDSLLTFNSISEGEMLGVDGADTVFGYGSVSNGKISEVYNSRNNTQTGIYANQSVFVIINFTADVEGASSINISNFKWVNSTITNNSAGVVENILITNFTIIITPSTSQDPPDSAGSLGGSSGGSFGSGDINVNNETNKSSNQGKVSFELEEGNESDLTNNFSSETIVDEGEQVGFFRLTGRFLANTITQSTTSKFVFVFIAIIIIVAVVLFVRRKFIYWKFMRQDKGG